MKNELVVVGKINSDVVGKFWSKWVKDGMEVINFLAFGARNKKLKTIFRGFFDRDTKIVNAKIFFFKSFSLSISCCKFFKIFKNTMKCLET